MVEDSTTKKDILKGYNPTVIVDRRNSNTNSQQEGYNPQKIIDARNAKKPEKKK